jgi:hypothetical protein
MNIELPNHFQDGVDLALDAPTGVTEVSDTADSTWHRKDLSEFRLTQEKFTWIPPD